MKQNGSFFWRRTPFLKLLLPLAAGIVLQWYAQPGLLVAGCTALLSAILFFLFFFLDAYGRFRLASLAGLPAAGLFLATGMWLTQLQDIRQHPLWVGHQLQPDDGLLVSLLEEPVEKNRTFRATARVRWLLRRDSLIPAKGKLILYMEKDSFSPLHYGDRLLLRKSPQEILPAGNPGGFDYRRYSLFRGITHQAFLRNNEYRQVYGKDGTRFQSFLFRAREKILDWLRRYIPGETEKGLAEALLIGYKNDLDPQLLQSFTQTGVVHVIAISGLHLGLIYGLLTVLLRPLSRGRMTKIFRTALIITGLWLFSLLAGGQPSVLRAALLFTCLLSGEALSRRPSVYNSLSVAAFLLLCHNPFLLWDAGFQLSFAAVTGIVTYMQPLYQCLHFPNRLVDGIWKMNAITLSAQLFTLPVSIYHFHQFPTCFLLSNLLAVPLSSLILIGEILLCLVSFFSPAARIIGMVLAWLIRLLTGFIQRIDQLPFSLWEGWQISFVQAALLSLAIGLLGLWLLDKEMPSLKSGLYCLTAFFLLRGISFAESLRQEKLIVYQVARQTAVDLVQGRKYVFFGSVPEPGAAAFNPFRATRIRYRIGPAPALPGLYRKNNCLQFCGKRIVHLKGELPPGNEPLPPIDLLLLSGNPKTNPRKLGHRLNVRQIVADGSVPAWKAAAWKKACDSLRIPFHQVGTEGAFVMNLR